MSQTNSKEIIIWVDSDKNVANQANILTKAGYSVKYCPETQDCINYINKHRSQKRIVGVITSMMESGGRKQKGLQSGLDMIKYIQQNLLSSLICVPEFAICSRSVQKDKCLLYGIEVIVKSKESNNPRKEVQQKLLKKIRDKQHHAVIIWVDSNPNAQKYSTLFEKESYRLIFFPETQNAMNYVNWYKTKKKISAVITSMMRRNGRQEKGLKDGLQMIDYIRNQLSVVKQKPIFAVVSSTCDKNECTQHSVDIIVKSSEVNNPWKTVKDKVLQAIVSNTNDNNLDMDEKQQDNVSKSISTDIVKNIFNASAGSKYKIHDIEYINSRSMEGVYEQILYIKCNEYKTNRKQIEHYGFHGSAYKGIESILSKGFDRDFNTVSRYGRGTYFAKNSIYSCDDRYTPINPADGCKYMLFCKIIVGKCIQGNSSMKQLPMNPTTNKQYDCLVDNVQNPAIYVISKDYHAVPVYLIKFKKK